MRSSGSGCAVMADMPPEWYAAVEAAWLEVLDMLARKKENTDG